MKKISFLLISLMVISIVFFNGCVENTNEDDNENFIPTGNVEIIDSYVESLLYNDTSTFIEGFYHSEDTIQFLINGTVKNNVGKMVSKINITAKFYDGNNTFLLTKNKYLFNVANKDTMDFKIEYYRFDKYFEIVEKVDLEIDYEL